LSLLKFFSSTKTKHKTKINQNIIKQKTKKNKKTKNKKQKPTTKKKQKQKQNKKQEEEANKNI
jgi:hypothetical protein